MQVDFYRWIFWPDFSNCILRVEFKIKSHLTDFNFVSLSTVILSMYTNTLSVFSLLAQEIFAYEHIILRTSIFLCDKTNYDYTN